MCVCSIAEAVLRLLKSGSDGVELILMNQVYLLQSTGIIFFTGEFGVVYRAHLIGRGDSTVPELVAVKTLKGA